MLFLVLELLCFMYVLYSLACPTIGHIGAVNQSFNQNCTKIGHSLTNLTTENESVPLPVHTKKVLIVEALADNLWHVSDCNHILPTSECLNHFVLSFVHITVLCTVKLTIPSVMVLLVLVPH